MNDWLEAGISDLAAHVLQTSQPTEDVRSLEKDLMKTRVELDNAQNDYTETEQKNAKLLKCLEKESRKKMRLSQNLRVQMNTISQLQERVRIERHMTMRFKNSFIFAFAVGMLAQGFLYFINYL